MAKACTLRPIINGEPSKLYDELHKYTGKDVRLTNFLYGIAINPDTMSKFSRKELNSQGEPDFDDFKAKYHLDSFIPSSASVASERRSIGAVDTKGNDILYDDLDAVYKKVHSYNESTSQFRAGIVYTDGKFKITLDRTDASNFRNNEVLDHRRAMFDGMMSYLSGLGFSTAFSDSTKAGIGNFINVNYMKHSLSSMKKSFDSLTEQKASLLLDLFKKDNAVPRLMTQFGNDAAKHVAGVAVEGDSYSGVDAYWRGIIEGFLNRADIRLQRIDEGDLETAQQSAVSTVLPSNAEFLGIKSDVLDSSLNELYEKYHINQDTIDSITENLRTLSDIARNILGIRANELALDRITRGNDKAARKEERAIRGELRSVDSGSYADGIVYFLSSLVNRLKDIDKAFELSAVQDEITQAKIANGYDLEKINVLSRYIDRNLKLVKAVTPIIQKMLTPDRLTLDQPDLPADFTSTVSDIATKLNTLLGSINASARDAQFETVVAFLTNVWGDEDIRTTPTGEQVSLRELVRTVQKDPNLFDRFIYSINESNDTGLSLIHNTIKSANRRRDSSLRSVAFLIRDMTARLFENEGNTEFMYSRKADGSLDGHLISYIDYNKYEEEERQERENLRNSGLKGADLEVAMQRWYRKHTVRQVPFHDGKHTDEYNRFCSYYIDYYRSIFGEDPPVSKSGNTIYHSFIVPRTNMYVSNGIDSLTSAQKEYYIKYIALKSVLTDRIPDHLGVFDAVQMTGDMINQLGNAGADGSKVFKLMKETFVSKFTASKNGDVYFSDTYGNILTANGYKRVLSDLDGRELMVLPLSFTEKLHDLSKLSTDASRSLMAYGQSAMQYYHFNKIIDSLLLTRDWFENERGHNASEGGKGLISWIKVVDKVFTSTVQGDKGMEASIIDDLYEKNIFERRKKDSGTVTIFGVNMSIDKAIDAVTGFTSRTGLVTNLMGAQANLLVGKVQMWIEQQAGEYFNMEDMAVADLRYFQHIVQYLNDIDSNNKSSFLGLLGERFDIMEDFYEELRARKFSKSIIGRFFSDPNLFFMYGIGENLLHYSTALAVLHNYRVRDTATGADVPLLEAYEKSYENERQANPDAKNLRLVLDTSRYKWLPAERHVKGLIGRPQTTYGQPREITEDDILKVEKDITYVNKSMHGAFNDIDKGAAHQYAMGRLIMNFRQWMPAHYERRFRTLHYDADANDWKEGFYNTGYRFLSKCIKGIAKGKFNVAIYWNELSDTEKYNIRRCLAEIETLMILSASCLSLGDYKDKKGNWAYRNLMYQMRRMLMETQASSPMPDLMPLFFGQKVNPFAFVDNIITVINSPMAAINTVDDVLTLFNFTNLFFTVQGGKYKGENLFVYNWERHAPYLSKIQKARNLTDDDTLFSIFEQ